MRKAFYRFAGVSLHMLSLCKKTYLKYIILNKRQILMKYFIISQLNYSSLIWMIYNRGLQNEVNHIYERAFRKVHDDCNCSFEDVLNESKSVTNHRRNLQ